MSLATEWSKVFRQLSEWPHCYTYAEIGEMTPAQVHHALRDPKLPDDDDGGSGGGMVIKNAADMRESIERVRRGERL